MKFKELVTKKEYQIILILSLILVSLTINLLLSVLIILIFMGWNTYSLIRGK